jgi:hypothetical protein
MTARLADCLRDHRAASVLADQAWRPSPIRVVRTAQRPSSRAWEPAQSGLPCSVRPSGGAVPGKGYTRLQLVQAPGTLADRLPHHPFMRDIQHRYQLLAYSSSG